MARCTGRYLHDCVIEYRCGRGHVWEVDYADPMLPVGERDPYPLGAKMLAANMEGGGTANCPWCPRQREVTIRPRLILKPRRISLPRRKLTIS